MVEISNNSDRGSSKGMNRVVGVRRVGIVEVLLDGEVSMIDDAVSIPVEDRSRRSKSGRVSESRGLDSPVIDINITVLVPISNGGDVVGGMGSVGSGSLEVVRDAISVKIGIRMRITESWVAPRVRSSLEGVDKRLNGGLRLLVFGDGRLRVSGWHVDGGQRDSDLFGKNSNEEHREN